MVTYVTLRSKEYSMDDFTKFDLNEVASIDIDLSCLDPCEHFCTFHFIDETKQQGYQTADQILALYKIAREKISTKVPVRHWHGRPVCIIS